MNHRAIAEKISERMHHLINLPAALAEIETLRLIGVGITQQIQETEAHIEDQRLLLEELLQKQTENSESLFSATQDVDDVFAALYRPVDAPAGIVQELAKKARSKKAPEPVEVPREKHPCHLCEDVYYDKTKLVKHLRAEHGVSLEEAVEDHGHDIDARKAQLVAEKADRDSKCDKWLDCAHAKACFDPEKAELQGVYCLPANEPCWNSSCTWSDLAQADHCDADEQYRSGRPVAECKCFINGIGPTIGQDAAACFNTNCPSNDPELPTCCAEWEEVWDCPEVVTAGWGPAKEEEQSAPVENQRQSIIRAAIAAGDDINEFGAFLNPEKVDIPMPKGCGHSANIGIATASDGSLYISANHTYPNGGSGGPPFVNGTVYQTRHAAILAGVAEIRKAWSAEPKSTKRTKALAALEEFAAKDHAPNSPTPAPSKEVEKQEVARPVDELPAQASEVVQPLICANLKCEYSDTTEPDNCGITMQERHGKEINGCTDFIQQETPHEAAPQEEKTETVEEAAAGFR